MTAEKCRSSKAYGAVELDKKKSFLCRGNFQHFL